MNFKIAVLIPDMHIPWHDVRAFDVAYKIMHDLPKIDELIILGDFTDHYAFSFHDDLPSMIGMKTAFEDEIYHANKILDRLDILNANKKIFLEGNHEYRLSRYMGKFARAIFDEHHNEKLFKCEERGWQCIPFARKNAYQLHRVLDTDVYCRHAPFSQGVHCAASTLQKKNISLIFGHTHRVQRIIKKKGNGEYIEGISNGCLIDFKAPVFSYMDTDDWAQAISVVYQYGDNPQDYLIDQIVIKDGKAVYQGNFYESDIKEEEYYRNAY